MWQLWVCMSQCTSQPVCMDSVSVVRTHRKVLSSGPTPRPCAITILPLLVLKTKTNPVQWNNHFDVFLLMDSQDLKIDSSHFLSMALYDQAHLDSYLFWPCFQSLAHHSVFNRQLLEFSADLTSFCSDDPLLIPSSDFWLSLPVIYSCSVHCTWSLSSTAFQKHC